LGLLLIKSFGARISAKALKRSRLSRAKTSRPAASLARADSGIMARGISAAMGGSPSLSLQQGVFRSFVIAAGGWI
jgi:hypothetical protein